MRALHCLTIAALLLAAGGAAAAADAETVQSLNGTWQLQRTSASGLEELGDAWQGTAVPSQLELGPEPYAWYRRTFALAGAATGKHVFLSFGGVKFASEVYVNGQRVGGHYGGWEPFEVEVTRACRAGQPNELAVRVHDVRAVIDGQVPFAPGRNLVEAVNGRVMAPVGSQTHLFGIWQDVGLVLREDVYIEDVTVVTSVRRRRIDATFAVRNLGDSARAVTVRAGVTEGGRPAFDMGSADATVPAGGTAQVILSKPWADAKLWGPDSPTLYSLESRLEADGREVDDQRTRFGFREFWTDGIYLVLNGARTKFLATAGHPPWNGQLLTNEEVRARYEEMRSANCMAMRLHANVWPENWYDVADEIGLPIIQESAIWCYSPNYALERKEFWDNAREHWRAVIRRDKNHPAIVMYSIENEILHVGGNRVPETEKNLGELGRFVKSLDPTRPIMYDGDEDPDGAADVINLHYPHEFPDNTLYPDTAYWLDHKTRITGWPYREWEWSRLKPLYMGEFLWVPAPSAQTFTLFLGDDAYADYAQGYRRSKAIGWEMQVEAYRAAEVAGMCPWTLWESGPFPNEQYDAVKRAYEPNAAIVKEYDTRFYAGEEVERTVFLYNDTLRPAELALEWSLGGRRQGQKAFAMQPGERVQTTLALTMPTVEDVRQVPFELTVKNGGRTVCRSVRAYLVFPRREPRFELPGGTRVAVYGGGPALDLLRRGGVEPVVLEDLEQVSKVQAGVLVIGAHALDPLAERDETPVVGGGVHEALAGFVRAGGAVLVLEQDKFPQDMFPAALTDRAATIAFKRSNAGGLLEGVDESGFKFWRGDHVVARRLIERPRAGGFRVFVDTGGPNGLDAVLAVELRQGEGRYILSQLLIGEKLGREPLAQLMFERLVKYAGARQVARTPLGLVRGRRQLDDDLGAAGAAFEDLTGRLAAADLSRFAVLVLDGTAEEAVAARGRLRDFVRAGGKVLLHGLAADTMERLSDTLPAGLTVRPSLHVPVLIHRKDDPVMDGMTNEDLHWIFEPGDWQRRSNLSTEVLHGEVTRRAPPLAECTVLEAEQMRLVGGPGAEFRPDGLYMWGNGSAEAAVTLPQTGPYFFGVVGSGTPVGGVFPEVAVEMDGKVAGHLQVGGPEPSQFAMVGQADAGPHRLRLSFTNDAWDPDKGEDRNLWLDKFFFAPSEPGPEEPLILPAGLVKLQEGAGFWLIDQVAWDGRVRSYDPAARYLSGLLTNLGVTFAAGPPATVISASRMESSETVNYNREGSVAYLGSSMTIAIDVRFAEAGRFDFVVNARGTPAAGEYPAIRLLLDGQAVGDRQLQQGGWQNLTYAAEVTSGVHRLALEFTNDAWLPDKGEDRNLWIRHVAISR
jgi:hypothetical protein